MYKHLLDLFFTQQQQYPNKAYCHTKYNRTDWTGLTYTETKHQILTIASALKQHGINRGDRVIILSESRNEWLIANMAIMLIGAISVPVYTTNTQDDHAFIITDSGAKGAFVSNSKLAEIFLPASTRLSLNTIFSFDIIENIATQSAQITHWDDMLNTPITDDIDEDILELRANDTACLIYTSGTSGNPKGVMLSHRSILANVVTAVEVIEEFDKPMGIFKLVSFLPLSHAYEHTVMFLMIAVGGQIYFTPSVDKLLPTIQEVKPHFVTCVPRLYEMIRERTLMAVKNASPFKQKLLYLTLELGQKHYEDPTSLTLKERMVNKILNTLVRKKIQKRFGGNLLAFVSGGAPLPYEIGVFFMAMNLTILQGYGQTETSPLISVTRPKNNNIASVGPALKGVDVKIADDGEILVKGDLLMQGYWNKPEYTAKTIINGWLHTGDVGKIGTDNNIYITDRKKDIIVNTGGDNIAPQRIEGIVCLAPEIAQCIVYGDRRPHLVALIVPNEDLLQQYPKNPDGTVNTELKSTIDNSIKNINKSLQPMEKIRNFTIVYDAFSMENRLMTTTLKLRRKPITQTYHDTLEGMY